MSVSYKAGGAAMAGGQHFQAQVTAWWCAHILLQTPFGSSYDLPVNSFPERLFCETMDSIDDLRVEFSGKELVFGQCKRSLSLSSNLNSDWASVLKQFFKETQNKHPSNIIRRFVLFYEKSNGNLKKLSTILNRYRQLPIGTAIIKAAENKQEQSLVTALISLLDSIEDSFKQSNIPSEREELLRNSYLVQLLLGTNEANNFGIVTGVRYNLLVNPDQANLVLNSLQTLADELLAQRGSANRVSLREQLLLRDIILKDTLTYRLDFDRLDKLSTSEISGHLAEGRSRLKIDNSQLSISRPIIQEMLNAAGKISFLVTGNAGTGKTGAF